MRVDYVKPESEFHVEQVRWVFEGAQASSCEDANIVVIKASTGASNHYSWVLFIILSYLLYLDVYEVIGVELIP
jgi:hypothetical protein